MMKPIRAAVPAAIIVRTVMYRSTRRGPKWLSKR